jgi:hypothetical protein
MAANYAIATIVWGASSITLLELMKQKLSIIDNAQDDELSMYLQIAGEAAEAYCDNVLAEQAASELHPVTFSPISLRYFPATAIASVDVDGNDVTADYSLYNSEGIGYATTSTSSATYPNGFKQLTINYTAGYEPLPADLGAAITTAAISYEQGTGATGEVKKESVVGVGSIEYNTSTDDNGSVGFLSASVTGSLDKYRRDYC